MERVADLTERFIAMQKAQSFVRYATALMAAGGDALSAVEIFKGRWPNSKHLGIIERAVVAPGSTVSGNWAEPLSPLAPLAAEFIELIRPRTIIGRMQGVRRVPFRIRFPRQTAGASVAWVGEGMPIPATALGFEDETFKESKIAGLVVVTQELVRSSDPAAEALIQRDLTNAIAAFSDQQLLDPGVAAIDNTSPASITNGATAVPSTGATAAQVEADLKAALAVLIAAGIDLSNPYWVMKPTTALHLATLRTVDGQRAFPGVTVSGGEIWGIPVLVSSSVGDRIVIVDAAEILLADDGADLDSSNQSAIELVTNPGTPTASTVQTSLWQHNLVGLMVRRFIRWERRRDGAVAYISGVAF